MIKIKEVNGIAAVDIKPIKLSAIKEQYGVYLGVRISNDNMLNSASFDWAIYTDNMYPISSGTVNCKDEDYESWGNSNEEAFTYVLSKTPQIEIA